MTEPRQKTKAEMVSAIAERTGLGKREVSQVLEAMAEVVLTELSAQGPGKVSLAGLVTAEIAAVPARSERAGHNPATGAPIMIAARPASKRGKIRLRPMKRLKDVL